jgi:hypothetical protein
VARTLVDLAEVVDGQGVQRAFHDAEVLRLLDTAAVGEAIQRANGRHRIAMVKEIVSTAEPLALTRSELERRMLDLRRRAGLPPPQVNAELPVGEVDFPRQVEQRAVAGALRQLLSGR